MPSQMWAYGVTTVPERRRTCLPRTLASLRAAGFDSPRLFVDNERDAESWRQEFKLEVTAHWPRMRAAPSWVACAWELFLRNPSAERFAIFQDDILACRNIRQYLEECPLPAEKCFLNLYTHGPEMQQLPPSPRHRGWYLANQLGKGALGLVFDRSAFMALLTAQHIVKRQGDVSTGRWKPDPDGRSPCNYEKGIDGGIVDALGQQQFTEWIHWPSLLQHADDGVSTIHNLPKKCSPSFPGEHVNALDFLPRSR